MSTALMSRAWVRIALLVSSLLLWLFTIFDLPVPSPAALIPAAIRLPESEGQVRLPFDRPRNHKPWRRLNSLESCAMAQKLPDFCVT